MNAHALEVLEYAEALAHVSTFAGSEVGAAAVRDLRPVADIDAIRDSLVLVGEGLTLLARHGWTMPHIPDLSLALPSLSVEGSAWEGETLRLAAVGIASSRAVRRSVLPLAEEFPGVSGLAADLGEFSGLQEQIERAIAEDGAVRDGASPELARLRREMHGARARIVARLTEFAASLPQHLQVLDASVGIRDGRYVIPVRRDGRTEVGGIVHGESQTGATLFVEPPVAIEMMNRLREMEAAEAREVLRILRELTALLRPYAADLARTLDRLTKLDTIYARARYAAAAGG